MKKVIVFGSMNMDVTIACDNMPDAGETVDGYGCFQNSGGKGANQAVAACKSGAPTYMIACVGQDLFGNTLVDALEGYGVHCRYIERSTSQPTGVAVITRSGGDNRIILSAGANHELTCNHVEMALAQCAEPGDIFMSQYETDMSATLEAFSAAHGKGLFTIFNPAPAKPIPEMRFKDIDLLVVNQSECRVLSGIDPCTSTDCEDALHFFAERGTSAILTLGTAGSCTLINGRMIQIPSYPVKAIDTTAAGDTFIGALAARILDGIPLAECMKYASKAAALTVTRFGAQQAIPTAEEVEKADF